MTTKYALYGLVCVLLAICVACHKPETTPISPTTLRISSDVDPHTFDPRLARNLENATIIHMLYEGLTRLDEQGQPALALAEDVIISPDQKTYTFKIRKSGWSDGQPITAYDFEESWKSVLDPKMAAPNAYQLYVIKGAKAAKEGQIDLGQVGIKAIDPQTLVVELDKPVPYFLHLTSTYFYYPSSPQQRRQEKTEPVISNGPFKLERWAQHNELVAIKNPHYWDRNALQLEKINIVVLDNATALQMFANRELDWTGSPLSTISSDALATLKQQGHLHALPSAGTYWLRFNTEHAPLNQTKMRLAMSLALNRKELVEHVLQGNQIPATGVVPPSFTRQSTFYRDYDIKKAQQLFQEALEENGITQNELGPLTICYASGERGHKIAQVVQQQWKEGLGLDVRLESCESKVYFDRIKSKQYQVSIGSWFADIRDPISFLDVFKFKNNGTNNTQWENPIYTALLEDSSLETNAQKRHELLVKAEAILVGEMPIAPLFYNTYNYLKQPNVKGIYFSELGYLDFKRAYKE